MRTQLVFVAFSFASFSAVACGSGDVTLGNNEYAIQKTSTGGRTGDGRHCFWSSGTQFSIGDAVPSQDSCNTCRCTSQGIGCTSKTCSVDAGVACTTRACALTCKFGDKVYQPGDSWSDGCNGCSCDAAGQVSCTAKMCVTCSFNGQTYLAGDTYPAGDGCNTCSCTAGGMSACTSKLCPTP